MIVFPNCKINLGLHIAGKRPDGYHALETIFYPLPLKDALEIITVPPVKRSNCPNFELLISGAAIPGESAGNLCQKAWELIKKDFPSIPPVKVYLHKTIPVGAGLGGGSSDGAHALLLLNRELELGIPDGQLMNYAAQLGSDCPFFILNKPCIATGKGEKMQEIDVDLEDHYFVLADPGIHVSTAWAFSQLDLAEKKGNGSVLVETISKPIALWKDTLVNDFEIPVFKKYPELKKIKLDLYQAGAAYAALTGTGSGVFAIFYKNIPAPASGNHYTIYNLNKNN